jgi:hypothetical protein
MSRLFTKRILAVARTFEASRYPNRVTNTRLFEDDVRPLLHAGDK